MEIQSKIVEVCSCVKKRVAEFEVGVWWGNHKHTTFFLGLKHSVAFYTKFYKKTYQMDSHISLSKMSCCLSAQGNRSGNSLLFPNHCSLLYMDGTLKN